MYTVFAICSFCSLSKEQKERNDEFGTSKEHMSSLDGVLRIRNHYPFGIEIKR